ncbi:hypothetical protein [Thalassospira sp. UBA1131]|uniref:hypothetical protein n=1 Tax=Thalassospira sp. UBA1131 TaxID=1947672 RepID=UPI0025F10955|nr:hypothetical protein [Thalassospira sp. UBA1131]
MPKKATVTQAEVTRIIKAANACGLDVCEIVVTADGVRLIYNKVDRPVVNDNIVGPKQWD